MFLLQFSIMLLLYGGIRCLDPMNHVLSPKTQILGVPKKINGGTFGDKGNLPGQVTLRNNLDNTVTHESLQLHLSPTYQHQRASSFKNKLEESANRDEVKSFVYLVDKKDLIKDEGKVQPNNQRPMATQEMNPDLKTPKRSKRQLEKEIKKEAQKISLQRLKKCCWDGYNHYMNESNCHKRLQDMKEKPNCYKAFAHCCSISHDYYGKGIYIGLHPLTYERFCVQMPKYWKVAEPQKITIFKPMIYLPDISSYLVRILLLSYPDKTVTYDSQEFLQNLDDLTKETSISLLLNLEDLPNGDETEKFVYLVVEYNGRTIEEKLQLLDLHVTQQDIKNVNILSVWETLENKIQSLDYFIDSTVEEDRKRKIDALASKYTSESAKNACQEGYMHYIQEWECQKKLTELEKKGTPGLNRVFQKCCLFTRKYYHILANTKPEKYNSNTKCEE